jgi:hypothetical protein
MWCNQQLFHRCSAGMLMCRGNLLEDTALLTSLNDIKSQASSVAAALQDGQALAAQLDEQRSAYRWAGIALLWHGIQHDSLLCVPVHSDAMVCC